MNHTTGRYGYISYYAGTNTSKVGLQSRQIANAVIVLIDTRPYDILEKSPNS